MHHNAMPRKASIRKSRHAPLSSASSPTNGLEVAFRSLISFLQTGKMGQCWSFWCEVGHTPRLMIALKNTGQHERSIARSPKALPKKLRNQYTTAKWAHVGTRDAGVGAPSIRELTRKAG